MDARARHDKMHEIGQRIEEWTLQICPPPFWSSDGTPNVNYDLLREVMRVPVRSGASARSGKLAAAIDLWCAWEFGHAGFSGEGLWPQQVEPRVIDPVAERLMALLPLNQIGRASCRERV